jgi:hypothetical protein
MKLAVVLLLGVVAGAVAQANVRQLQTVGPADVAAAEAVGEAVLNTGLSMKKVAADVSKAKAHEAYINYKADKKVARAVAHAMKHSGGHLEKSLAQAALPGIGGVAVAGAALAGLESAHISAHDSKRIAHAVAKAARMKAHAKSHTLKVVVKSVGEAAASNLAHGAKAAAAVGAAALNDAATFAPILSGLAPTFLPQLASVATAGPAGLVNVLGNLAQSIGGALLGNSNIGVAGPDLLATRVVSMLPNDLLSSFVDGVGGVGGGLSPAGLEGLIQNMPPQVLENIVSFLTTGNIPGVPAGLPNLLSSAPMQRQQEEEIHVPQNALEAILHSITGLMDGNRRQQNNNRPRGLFNLPQLPPGGLPLPLRALSNLLGVLPHPDLSGVLRMLPPNPLMNLVRGLPLGVQEE